MIGVDCKDFLPHYASALDWSDLSGKTVLDIGCGNGGNSTFRLLELYPNVGKVIAIDNDPDSIEVALYENKHPKVEYHVADIESWPTLTNWEGQMDVVLSHYCFNYLGNKQAAFENVLKLLMPGGTAAIFFTTSASFYDWGKEMGEIYSEYAADLFLDPPLSHQRNYGASHYQDPLKEIGFAVIGCEDVHHENPIKSDEECINYLSSICPIKERLPTADVKSFQENALKVYLKHNPKNEEGFTSVKQRAVKILLGKPLEKE